MKVSEKFSKAEFVSRCGGHASSMETAAGLLYDAVLLNERQGRKVVMWNNCCEVAGRWKVDGNNASPLGMLLHGLQSDGTSFFNQAGAVLGISIYEADAIDDGFKGYCLKSFPLAFPSWKAMREMFLEAENDRSNGISSKVVYL